MPYDVIIVGGGPAGLSAALALGRARKRVLLCDAGARRNQTAERVHNFLTRDGTPPDELRQVAREQLDHYPNVEVRDIPIASLAGAKGAFQVVVGAERIEARRVLLCTGMLDELLPIEGFRELWGRGIFQCPYCHGWEEKDRPWGYLVRPEQVSHFTVFALQLRGWTEQVTVFTGGEFELPVEALGQVTAAGIRVETGRIERLLAREGRLEAVELAGGVRVRCQALFAHPPQRQVELVRALGVALDKDGFVQVDPMTRETTVAGVFAAGDLTSRMQAAIAAAASGMQAAAMLNHELTAELALSGTGRLG
jgi:thioredoxin reductase